MLISEEHRKQLDDNNVEWTVEEWDEVMKSKSPKDCWKEKQKKF